jgi:hypothetical protein
MEATATQPRSRSSRKIRVVVAKPGHAETVIQEDSDLHTEDAFDLPPSPSDPS